MKISELISESTGKTITGIHFSTKQGITSFRKDLHSTGIVGAERKRATAYPESFIKGRVYFYDLDAILKGDIKREPGLGTIAYKATLKNVYDGLSDPLNLKKVAVEQAKEQEGVANSLIVANLFEQAIVSAGYSGYTLYGVVIMFENIYNIEPLGRIDKDSIDGDIHPTLSSL